MSPDRYRVGVYSLAHVHAASYIGLLLKRDDVEVLVWDSVAEPGRGAQFAAELGASYTASEDEFFAWRPDAVIVCNENAGHRAAVEKAAAAGAHILCEKPLATSRSDAEAMVALCAEAGVALMVAYPVRYAPEFLAMREALRRGELGEVLSITGTNNGMIPVGQRAWFTDPVLAGGGALVDHTVHVADLIESLLEARPLGVRAVANRILHADKPGVAVETGGLVHLDYDGFTAVVDCSWSQPDNAPTWGGLTIELVTTKGNLAVAPFAPVIHGMTDQGSTALAYDVGVNLDEILVADFLAVVRGEREPGPGGQTGIRGAAIVETALLSAAAGGSVETISW